MSLLDIPPPTFKGKVRTHFQERTDAGGDPTHLRQRVLNALQDGPHDFGALLSATGAEHRSSLSSVLQALRKAGKIEGEGGHRFIYRLAEGKE